MEEVWMGSHRFTGQEENAGEVGGQRGIRTPDILLVRQAL
jgi:hypothetical protein